MSQMSLSGDAPDKNDTTNAAVAERLAQRRKNMMIAFGALIVGVALVGAGWWYMVASRSVSTENAYVEVSSAQVTPLTGGRVMEVRVHDAEMVRKGDVVVLIDPEDAQITVAQAEASYGATLRKVQTYFSAVTARRADYERAKAEYDRRERVKGTGAVSTEELGGVRAASEAASAALESAEALTLGTTVDRHPEVLAAKAQLDSARLALRRTVVRAPVSGIVAQRSVQVGQMVASGRAVMTIVPISDVYVNANFKEDQLAKVHPGQNVTLVSDLYGSDVEFHGRVVGVGGGTGSAFALIPAQNATGNWIKVVQRVPVRIALDPAELQVHPLRVGLSMQAKIHVAN